MKLKEFERLSEIKDNLALGKDELAYNHLKELLKENASKLEGESGWISVLDRKPPTNENVLLLVNEVQIQGCIDANENYSFIRLDYHGCGSWSGYSDEVTHWRKLPK